jgi:glycosyltransferase involved in cell wall biosynthesis
MKICFLAGTLGRGGAERQLTYMLRAVLRAKGEPRVLCLTEGEVFEDEIKSLGVNIDYVGASSNKAARTLEIIKNLRRRPADIVQSAHFYTNLYAAVASRILKVKSIGAIRSDLKSEVKAHGWLGQWQVKMPTHLIANSAVSYERAIKMGISSERIDFVRNVVDIGDGRHDFSSNAPLKIIFVGRLVKIKRPERFVRLAHRLTKDLKCSSLHFKIVGDGALKTDLENLARELQLSSEVLTFTGDCDQMDRIYRSADILVLTSEYEGTPNVLLEAMAHGVSVVAAKVGGVPEMLDETRGFLVDAESENELFEATRKLIEDAGLRRKFGENGYQYVSANHSLEYLKNKLTSVYQKLL